MNTLKNKKTTALTTVIHLKKSMVLSLTISALCFIPYSAANNSSGIISSKSTAASVLNNITFEQIKKDVSYLASDDFQGRANFSNEIAQAGNYIAQRFKETGLNSPENIKDFKQTFYITNIVPKTLTVEINGESITANNLAVATTSAEFSWQSPHVVTTHIIGEQDDMRAMISKINHQGGNHLVLLHPSHEKMYRRYQAFFQNGLTKLITKETTKGGTLVIALTDIVNKEDNIKALKITGSATLTKQALTNIVGVLPGKTLPDEIVLYSAHYDHLGVNPEGSGDKIFNGADDDASGTSAIINLAAHFSKMNNNARTLMFVAFSAEEIGGFGSKYFSKQLDANSITAMINVEMIGKPSKFGAGMVWMTGMERSNLGLLLNNALADSDMKVYKDPYPEQGLFYRSDNATLARLGVPAHSFSSTQLDKDKHYHQVSDDLASLDLASMHKVIQALAIATQGLVDGSITPSRIDPNLVKGKGLIY